MSEIASRAILPTLPPKNGQVAQQARMNNYAGTSQNQMGRQNIPNMQQQYNPAFQLQGLF